VSGPCAGNVSGTDLTIKGDNILRASWELQAAASARGFDWPDIGGVLDKIAEELNEIRDALRHNNRHQARRELGDLLLAAVNAARFLETDPAQELYRANSRFQTRFEALLHALECEGRSMESCTLEELDAVWNRVKANAKQTLEEGS